MGRLWKLSWHIRGQVGVKMAKLTLLGGLRSAKLELKGALGTVRLSSAKGSYRRGLLPPIVWGEFKASQPIDARPTRSQLSRPTPSGHFIHMAHSAYAVNNTSYTLYTCIQTQDGRTDGTKSGRTERQEGPIQGCQDLDERKTTGWMTQPSAIKIHFSDPMRLTTYQRPFKITSNRFTRPPLWHGVGPRFHRIRPLRANASYTDTSCGSKGAMCTHKTTPWRDPRPPRR